MLSKYQVKRSLHLWAWVFLGILRCISYLCIIDLDSVSSSPYQDYIAIFRSQGFTANPRTPKDMNCHLYHRQVHSCIPFDVFLSKYLQSYLYVPLTCIKKKKYFRMMWYILLVGGGTMVRWIGTVFHRMGRYISLGN